MRLAVLSDTHGNLPALTAVLEDIAQHDVDGMIIAGDYIAGPHPVETLRLLRSFDAWMIRGNGDDDYLRYASGNAPAAWYTSLQFGLLRWAHRHINQETFDFINSLPAQEVVKISNTSPIRVVHGSPRNPAESIFPHSDPAALDLALSQIDERVMICGHTHIPWKVERGGRLALNPGSVAGPLNGDPRAQYALLTWQGSQWRVEHRAIPYDLGQIRTDFTDSGLLEEGGALAQAFLIGIETGENVGEDFLIYAYRLAGENGFEDCKVVPDEIWRQAAATFDWEKFTLSAPITY